MALFRNLHTIIQENTHKLINIKRLITSFGIVALVGLIGAQDRITGKGSMQPQGHAQIVVNMIDFGMNLQEAGDAPRIRHGGSSQPTGEKMSDGGIVYLESGIPYENIRELIRRGHRIQHTEGGFGGYQAILWDEDKGVYFGASESRKDGQAAGY